MVKSTLSASAAARYLGYKTANPIFDAIRSGELAAERGPAGRNGRTTTNYRIQLAELDKLAIARGITPNGTEIVLEPVTNGALADHPDFEFVTPVVTPVEAPTEPVSNVAALVPTPWASVEADRLALLVKLVKAGQLDAAQLVITAWEA